MKKLNRYQLLELLVAQTERADNLQKKVEELEAKLEDKELKFSKLGSIAEAVIYISGVLESTQEAADMYMNSVKKEADDILENAHRQATSIIERADREAGCMSKVHDQQ